MLQVSVRSWARTQGIRPQPEGPFVKFDFSIIREHSRAMCCRQSISHRQSRTNGTKTKGQSCVGGASSNSVAGCVLPEFQWQRSLRCPPKPQRQVRKQVGNTKQHAKGVRLGGINWETGIDIYTLLYINRVTNRGLLCGTGNSTPRSVTADVGGESARGGGHINMCIMADSLCCTPQAGTTL